MPVAATQLTSVKDTPLAWHAIKVILAFSILERRRLPSATLPEFMSNLAFADDVNRRYLGLAPDELASRAERELLLVNAIRREDGWLLAP